MANVSYYSNEVADATVCDFGAFAAYVVRLVIKITNANFRCFRKLNSRLNGGDLTFMRI